MATSNKTLIATHDPIDILERNDEKNGAIPYEYLDPIEQDDLVFQFPIKTSYTTYPLHGVFKVKASMDMLVDGGVGKTTWATNLKAQAVTDSSDPNKASLVISDDKFQAGKILGIDLNPSFEIEIWRIHYHWFSHSWDKKEDWKKGPYRFSIISILSDIVAAAIQLGDAIPFADIIAALFPQNVDTAGYYDKGSDIVKNNNKISLKPELVGDIDLINFFTTIGEDIIRAAFLPTIAGEAIVDIILAIGDVELAAVSFVSPQIAFGPSFGMASPVDISIKEFWVDYNNFTVTGKDSDSNSILGEGEGNTPVDSFAGKELSVKFNAKSHYNFVVGGFIQISWLKVLKLHVRKTKDVIKQGYGTVDSTFTNYIGAPNLDDATLEKGDIEGDVST